MFHYQLNRNNITYLYKKLKEVIDNGEKEIFIIYENDDILEWNEPNFLLYKDELSKVIPLLFKDEDLVYLNVISDLLIAINDVKEDYKKDFLFCKTCPCMACKVNTDLFHSATNDSYIPPINYCKRSFIEYEASREFIKLINLEINLEDVNIKEYFSLLFKAYGNDLEVEVENYAIQK